MTVMEPQIWVATRSDPPAEATQKQQQRMNQRLSVAGAYSLVPVVAFDRDRAGVRGTLSS